MPTGATRSSLLQASTLLLLFTAVGGLIWYEPELTSLRPESTRKHTHGVFGTETVDARLWQDPLDFVAKNQAHLIQMSFKGPHLVLPYDCERFQGK